VIKRPILAILNFSLKEISFETLNNFRITNKTKEENKTRYQTKSPSFNEISLPKTPVKPASITAMCNKIYDFFIRLSKSLKKTEL
jgi:tRNA U34 5-methylaminomethyl-2-thiouridine-forming methyltransferase MnmC